MNQSAIIIIITVITETEKAAEKKDTIITSYEAVIAPIRLRPSVKGPETVGTVGAGVEVPHSSDIKELQPSRTRPRAARAS